MPKTVVVVGVTGNQGGSVARRFLKDPAYHVRGCTRQDPNSESVKPLVDAGIEIVQVDLDDYESVRQAFKGASVIFTVTNYWEPFFRPDCRRQAAERGISCRKFAYDVEYRHGKNMADAANETVETLDENGFLVSTLSHAYQSSNMRFHELYHFDAKADIFPNYVKIAHPALAVKMSCIQTGYFMTSYKLAPEAYFSKVSRLEWPIRSLIRVRCRTIAMSCALQRLQMPSYPISMSMPTLETLCMPCPNCLQAEPTSLKDPRVAGLNTWHCGAKPQGNRVGMNR